MATPFHYQEISEKSNLSVLPGGSSAKNLMSQHTVDLTCSGTFNLDNVPFVVFYAMDGIIHISNSSPVLYLMRNKSKTLCNLTPLIFHGAHCATTVDTVVP